MSNVARSLLAAASFITLGSVPADAQSEIVLHTSRRDASGRLAESFRTARLRVVRASGTPIAVSRKLASALASPADYFQLTFTADANRPVIQDLGPRSADNNSWTNDSVFLQFTNSVNTSGSRRSTGSARRAAWW